MKSHVLLATIATAVDMKRWLESKDANLGLRKKYQNICDLCAELVYHPRCQELLIEHGHERRDDILAAKIATDVTMSADFVYCKPDEGTSASNPVVSS